LIQMCTVNFLKFILCLTYKGTKYLLIFIYFL
jgi:hypothetical protein